MCVSLLKDIANLWNVMASLTMKEGFYLAKKNPLITKKFLFISSKIFKVVGGQPIPPGHPPCLQGRSCQYYVYSCRFLKNKLNTKSLSQVGIISMESTLEILFQVDGFGNILFCCHGLRWVFLYLVPIKFHEVGT